MADVKYMKIKDIQWSDRVYQFRELPEFHGFPMIVKVIKSGSNLKHIPQFKAGEILRLDGVEHQRRLIAIDSKNRHWSFPIHIGAKFDTKDKKGRRSSVYMSDMVEGSKVPKNLKKFRFAEKDVMPLKINGEASTTTTTMTTATISKGDFECKDVIRVGIFKANRISEEELDPRVLLLPAYIDIEVAVATMISGEPGEFWEEYMDAMTQDIMTKVNLNMYRGKADILIYEFPKKRKLKITSLMYETCPPMMSISIATTLRKRPGSERLVPKIVKTADCQDTDPEKVKETDEEEEDKDEHDLDDRRPSGTELLHHGLDEDEEGMTEEELHVARHRRRMLMMLDMMDDGDTGTGCDDTQCNVGVNGKDDEEDNDGDGMDDQNDEDADILSDDSADVGDGNEEGGRNCHPPENGDNDDASYTDDVYNDNDGINTREEGDGRGRTEGKNSPTSTGDVQEEHTTKDEDTIKRSEDVKPSVDEITKRPRSPGDGSTIPGRSPEADFVVGNQSAPCRRVPPSIPPRVNSRLSFGPIFPGPTVPSDNNDEGTVEHETLQTGPAADEPSPIPEQPPPQNAPTTPSPVPKPRLRPRTGASMRSQSYAGGDGVVTPLRRTSRCFSHIQEFPSDLGGLTIEDMCAALSFLNLGQYEVNIREHSIDGEMAKELTEDMLKIDMGMSGLAAKKMMRFIHSNWRPM